MTILFHPDGTVEMADAPEASDLGQVIDRRRFSHILPRNAVKRFAFIIIRGCVTDNGRIAAWTRNWRGPWEVRFVDDPRTVAFTHASRKVCVKWEVDRLNERLGG